MLHGDLGYLFSILRARSTTPHGNPSMLDDAPSRVSRHPPTDQGLESPPPSYSSRLIRRSTMIRSQLSLSSGERPQTWRHCLIPRAFGGGAGTIPSHTFQYRLVHIYHGDALIRALTIDPDRYYQPKEGGRQPHDNEEVSRKFQVQGVTHHPGTNSSDLAQRLTQVMRPVQANVLSSGPVYYHSLWARLRHSNTRHSQTSPFVSVTPDRRSELSSESAQVPLPLTIKSSE